MMNWWGLNCLKCRQHLQQQQVWETRFLLRVQVQRQVPLMRLG